MITEKTIKEECTNENYFNDKYSYIAPASLLYVPNSTWELGFQNPAPPLQPMEFVRFLRCLTGEGGVDLTETSDLEPVTYKPFGTMPSNDGISSVDIIGPNNGEAGGGVGADAAGGNEDFDDFNDFNDFNDFEFFNNEEEGLDVGVSVGVDVGMVIE